MGRSLAPVAAAAIPDLDEAADGRTLFEADGLEYSVERRDGRVFHRETRRDASGRIVARNEAEVRYILGSGNQGASFLIDRHGFVFQSPISWYVASGGGTSLRAIAGATPTSTGSLSPHACTATRTGSSRWKGR